MYLSTYYVILQNNLHSQGVPSQAEQDSYRLEPLSPSSVHATCGHHRDLLCIMKVLLLISAIHHLIPSHFVNALRKYSIITHLQTIIMNTIYRRIKLKCSLKITINFTTTAIYYQIDGTYHLPTNRDNIPIFPANNDKLFSNN